MSKSPLPPPAIAYSRAEELFNSLSHGLGLLFGIAAVPWLVYTASTGSWNELIGASVYGFSFLLIYTASTLYHSFQEPSLKHRLRIFDHVSIYVMIAGSYTPFVLIYVNNATGFTILTVLWSLTLIGLFFKVFYTGRFEKLSVGIYLLMGWMLIFGARSFWENLPDFTIWPIAVGGLLYSLGVIFYRWESLRFHHGIWHLFVLAGSLFHFVAVFWSVGSTP